MLTALMHLARPALLVLDPETAHETTLRALEKGLYPADRAPDPPTLASRLGDLELTNPIAIAAGFDKDARVPDAVLGLGCGFAEIGTVTPLAQTGNPKPRVFRLISERGVINRLGFNNGGHDAALARLTARARLGRRTGGGIVGVNIGANKDTADRTGDYVKGIAAFYDVASYFTVNISSPNTPGLRDLQAPAALDELLGRVMEARAAQTPASANRVAMPATEMPGGRSTNTSASANPRNGVARRPCSHHPAAPAVRASSTSTAAIPRALTPAAHPPGAGPAHRGSLAG
jgi:dihydroorotate dehydrogenase